MAGLPAPVLDRAREVLRLLEGEQLAARLQESTGPTPSDADLPPGSGADHAAQLPLFAAREHPVVERLRALRPERTTPLDALHVLDELVRMVQ